MNYLYTIGEPIRVENRESVKGYLRGLIQADKQFGSGDLEKLADQLDQFGAGYTYKRPFDIKGQIFKDEFDNLIMPTESCDFDRADKFGLPLPPIRQDIIPSSLCTITSVDYEGNLYVASSDWYGAKDQPGPKPMLIRFSNQGNVTAYWGGFLKHLDAVAVGTKGKIYVLDRIVYPTGLLIVDESSQGHMGVSTPIIPQKETKTEVTQENIPPKSAAIEELPKLITEDTDKIKDLDPVYLKNKIKAYQTLANAWREPVSKDILDPILDQFFTDVAIESILFFLPDQASIVVDITSSIQQSYDNFKKERSSFWGLGFWLDASQEEKSHSAQIVFDYHCEAAKGLCVEGWQFNYGEKPIPQILSEHADLLRKQLHYRGEYMDFSDWLNNFLSEGKNEQKASDYLAKQKADLQTLKKLVEWLNEREAHAVTEDYKALVKITKMFLENDIQYLESLP